MARLCSFRAPLSRSEPEQVRPGRKARSGVERDGASIRVHCDPGAAGSPAVMYELLNQASTDAAVAVLRKYVHRLDVAGMAVEAAWIRHPRGEREEPHRNQLRTVGCHIGDEVIVPLVPGDEVPDVLIE